MAEASHWFDRYRGLAVAIAASGNYIGGAIWPPVVNWGMQSAGWHNTHIAIGIFTAVAMTLSLILLRLLIGSEARRSHVNASWNQRLMPTPLRARPRAGISGPFAGPAGTISKDCGAPTKSRNRRGRP